MNLSYRAALPLRPQDAETVRTPPFESDGIRMGGFQTTGALSDAGRIIRRSRM